MSVVTNDQQKDDGPIETADQMRARTKSKNLAVLLKIVGLAVLFFVITILRMS